MFLGTFTPLSKSAESDHSDEKHKQYNEYRCSIG